MLRPRRLIEVLLDGVDNAPLVRMLSRSSDGGGVPPRWSDVRRPWLALDIRHVVSRSTFEVQPMSSLGDGVTLGMVGCGRSESL